MPKHAIAIILTVLAAAIALTIVAPAPAGTVNADERLTFHAYFLVSTAVAIAYAGASVLFIMGLNSFTDRFKRVYAFICLALTSLAVAFLQLPQNIYLVPFSTYWKDKSITALTFVFAIALIYIGARALARLFGVRSLATRPWFAILLISALATLAVLCPHLPTSTPEVKFDGANGMNTTSATAMALAAILLLQTKRIASTMYTKALAWMILSFGITALGGYADVMALLAVGDDKWYLIGAFPLLPLLIGGLFMLRAAYIFNTIAASADDTQGWIARDFFGRPLEPKKQDTVSSTDIVVYAANLVSSPANISQTLDHFRQITASLNAKANLTDANQSELRNIYLEIENYLLKDEPIRKFTKESLRQTIATKLHLAPGQTTFWSQLT
jgi:hypothetical protein